MSSGTGPVSGLGPSTSVNTSSAPSPNHTQLYANSASGIPPTGTGELPPPAGYNVSGTVGASGGRPYGTAPPIGTAPYGARPSGPPASNISSNATFCGGTTINIPDATLNWWYTTDFDFAAATISAQFNNNDSYTGWTLIPASTTFNVTSALAAPTYSTTIVYNTYLNESVEYYYGYTTTTPDYASTAIITQTATKPLNTSTGSVLPSDIIITPAPASTVLPGASSVAVTALTNTPFVYFSEFAVDVEKPTKAVNGSLVCATSRKIHTLPSVYALYYDQEDPEGQDEVVGDLPDAFTKELAALNLPLAQVSLGTYVAEPTLLVVVEKVYVAQAVLAVSTEVSGGSTLILPSPKISAASLLTYTPQVASSQASLLLPTPTTGIYVGPTGVAFIAHTEVAQSSLDLPSSPITQVTGSVSNPTLIPFTAVVGNVQTTFLAPANDAGSITTTVRGSIVVTAQAATATGVSPPPPSPQGQQTGTAVGAQLPTSTDTVNIGGLGGIVSAIQSGAAAQGSSSASSGSGSNSGSGSSGGSGSSSGGSPSESSSGSSGSGSGSGSGSTGSSTGGNGNVGGSSGGTGTGTGTNNNPAPAQSPDLSNLLSAIGQAGSASAVPQATVGSGGSSSNPGSGGSSSGGEISNGQSGSGSVTGSSGSSGSVAIPILVAVGGTTTSIGPSSDAVFGSQTLVPGGPAITISGTPVSLGPSAVVIGTETHSFAASQIQPPGSIASSGLGGSGSGVPTKITIGGSTITQAPAPFFVVGGQTVLPGQTITVNNKAVSVGAGGVLVVDGTSISIAVPGSPMTLTTAGETVVIGPTPAFVLGGSKTLVAGGPAITFDGSQLSLAPSASALIIDGSVTSHLLSAATAVPLALTVGSDTFTANAATQFLIASGTVLTPGGQVIVGGATVSLGSGGAAAVVNGVTQTLSPPIITPAPRLTLGGSVFEANLGSTFDIDGQQLTPGGVVIVDGSTISLASDASSAVIDGVTETFEAVQRTPTPTSLAVLNVNGNAVTADSGSAFVISGSTLTPGGIITIGSGNLATTISLGRYGAGVVVINGVTSTISTGPSPTGSYPPLTIDGQVYSADGSGDFVIAGQTLIPGGSAITFSTNGHKETVFLNTGGSSLLINGVTSTIPSAGSATTPGPLTIDGQIYTAVTGTNGPSYIISGQTLTEGGIVTFTDKSGHTETVSLSPDGSDVVINGVTSTISPVSTITAAPEITVDGQIITPLTNGGGSEPTYLVSGKLLTPGNSIVFNGPNGLETVSLSPDGRTLFESVSGASTVSTLPTAFATAQTAAPLITIGSDTFTALPGPGPSYRLPDGQTLYPGGPELTEVISGSTFIVTLSAGATVLVVEDVGPNGVVTSTEYETLFPATLTGGRGGGTATRTTNIGGTGITSTGVAGGAVATQTGDPASLQGSAASLLSGHHIGTSLAVGAAVVAAFALLL